MQLRKFLHVSTLLIAIILIQSTQQQDQVPADELSANQVPPLSEDPSFQNDLHSNQEPPQQQKDPEQVKKDKAARRARERNCNPDLPNLSVGDVNLTSKNFEKFKKDNEVFILGISDNQCDHCCYTEGMLDSVHSSLQTMKHTYNGKRIKLARLDLFQKVKYGIKEREAFDQVPKMMVYKKGEYYPYESYYMKGLFLHFINRVIYPVVSLKSEADIDRFLDSDTEFVENSDFYKIKYEEIGDYYKRMGKRVRVIAFFHDKKEYSNELKLFKEAAQKLAKRDDLRIGLVTNQTLVEFYRQKHGVKWFDEYSHNTIVLERSKDEFVYYDVEKDDSDLAYWINKMSLQKHGDELNKETSVIAKLLGETQAYLYLDRSNLHYGIDSKVAMSAMERVAPNWFDNRINFFYVEKDEYMNKRTNYGIMWSRLPAFVLITPKGNYYPIDMNVRLGDEQNVESILNDHLLNYAKGRLSMPQQEGDTRLANRDFEILEKLSNTRRMNKKNFRDMIMSPDHDNVVLVYTSDKTSPHWEKCHKWAYDYDTVAMRFRDLKIKSVVLSSYDLYVDGLNAEIDDPKVPAIYLYPAKEKADINKIAFTKKSIDLLDLMKFVEKNAEIKFTLPKNAHLPKSEIDKKKAEEEAAKVLLERKLENSKQELKSAKKNEKSSKKSEKPKPQQQQPKNEDL